MPRSRGSPWPCLRGQRLPRQGAPRRRSPGPARGDSPPSSWPASEPHQIDPRKPALSPSLSRHPSVSAPAECLLLFLWISRSCDDPRSGPNDGRRSSIASIQLPTNTLLESICQVNRCTRNHWYYQWLALPDSMPIPQGFNSLAASAGHGFTRRVAPSLGRLSAEKGRPAARSIQIGLEGIRQV